jgi:hypothetical protein
MNELLCPVCRTSLGENVAVCSRCETPHHPDCWEFGGACAVFACGGMESSVVPIHSRPQLDQEPVILEGPFPDTPSVPPVRICAERRNPLQDSQAVALISWLYLGFSLIWAAPAMASLLLGFLSWNPLAFIAGMTLGMGALVLKGVGDLIAVGDPRGRLIHLALCGLLSVLLPSPESLLIVVLAALPFLTQRGVAHFGLRRP